MSMRHRRGASICAVFLSPLRDAPRAARRQPRTPSSGRPSARCSVPAHQRRARRVACGRADAPRGDDDEPCASCTPTRRSRSRQARGRDVRAVVAPGRGGARREPRRRAGAFFHLARVDTVIVHRLDMHTRASSPSRSTSTTRRPTARRPAGPRSARSTSSGARAPCASGTPSSPAPRARAAAGEIALPLARDPTRREPPLTCVAATAGGRAGGRARPLDATIPGAGRVAARARACSRRGSSSRGAQGGGARRGLIARHRALAPTARAHGRDRPPHRRRPVVSALAPRSPERPPSPITPPPAPARRYGVRAGGPARPARAGAVEGRRRRASERVADAAPRLLCTRARSRFAAVSARPRRCGPRCRPSSQRDRRRRATCACRGCGSAGRP